MQKKIFCLPGFVFDNEIIIAIKRGDALPSEDILNDSLMDFYIKQLEKEGQEGLKRKLINISQHFKQKMSQKFIDLIVRLNK